MNIGIKIFIRKIIAFLKKVLFPLYKERHKFLYKKVWFRILIVLYIIGFVITPFYIYSQYWDANAGWCYDNLDFYYGEDNFSEKLAECSQLAKDSVLPGIGIASLGLLIIHYLIQVLFFKLLIDFIMSPKIEAGNNPTDNNNTVEKTNKLSWPAAVIVASLVIGGSLYAVQASKQQSIEKQQRIELDEKKSQQELENQRAELKSKQDECQSLSTGVRQKWNNVVGVTYDDGLWKECVVTYTDPDTGKIETSPLRLMQDTK